MLKFVARNIRSLQIFFDLLLMALAWAISYSVRFLLVTGAEQGLSSLFLGWFLPLAALTHYFLLKNRMYEWSRMPSIASDVMTLMRANAVSVVSFIVLLYFISDGRISRLTLIIYAAVSTLLLIFGRVAFRSFTRKLRRRGYLLKRVIVIGDGSQVPKYLQVTDYRNRTGIQVQKVLSENIEETNVEALIKELSPDIVVLGFANESSPFVAKFIAKFYDSLFITQVLPAERQAVVGLTSEMIDDVHVLTLNHPQFSAPEVMTKRFLDFFASGLGLLVLSPLLGVLAILTKLSSPGPIFFGQERVGVDGGRFKMWKFRSMRISDKKNPAAEWTVENDPRRTKIGTFMRKTSLDELPQLWNVFVGQMSLVGPRPEQPYFVEKFRSEIPAYMLRHKMKAGITGWAQVNGWRGDTSLHKRIECDLYYIRNWSFWFDVKILVLTFVKGFVNKNAY